jgi:hypothetical protein
MPVIPKRNIIILKNELEIITNYRFFWYKPVRASRTPAGHKFSGVFADVPNRLPIYEYGNNIFEWLGPDIADPPPPY